MALVLLVLAIQFWPNKQSSSRGLRAKPPIPKCARAVVRDWLADDRIDGTYPRSCYEAILPYTTPGDYGSNLEEALLEKLG